MYGAGGSPLDVPTPHHLLDGFLAARAETMPEEILARDRAVIESFRAFLVSRDEPRCRVFPPNELAGRRSDRSHLTPHDVLAARRITLEIRTFVAAGSRIGTTTRPEEGSGRLVLRLLGRWMLRRHLINDAESLLIDETTHPHAPIPRTRRHAYGSSRASRRLW